ncbi:MAG TPA: hypothetical protein VLA60_14100 [Nitrospirales bacterium]|nr:hypothetical protein [Nitrospirales bacterium]
MKRKVLQLAAASLVLGLLNGKNLPDIATEALVEGEDSYSLRILAGLLEPSSSEGQMLLEKVFLELAIPKPNRIEAALHLSKEVAGKILEGQLSPYHGAKKIDEISLLVPLEDILPLHPFINWSSEWEERPEDHAFMDNAIIEAAKDLNSLIENEEKQ